VDVETTDAEKVDHALELFQAGDLGGAQRLLAEVVANAPDEYAYQRPADTGVAIYFWDMHEFIHYATWTRDHGAPQEIRWHPSAYPRALYYLGFLALHCGRSEEALGFLRAGERLEPTNPRFVLERAQALIRLRRYREALALYDRVTEIGPHVSATHLAAAKRGRGFVLIELGDLDGAEEQFRASLEHDPESESAASELQYIVHLRSGGAPSFKTETSQIRTPDPTVCSLCGDSVVDGGSVVNDEGRIVSLCAECGRKLSER
jgi:tetratricopeptide (TPR) repeat protein